MNSDPLIRTLSKFGRVNRYGCDASNESDCEIKDTRDDETDGERDKQVPDGLEDDDRRDEDVELKSDDDGEGVFVASSLS